MSEIIDNYYDVALSLVKEAGLIINVANKKVKNVETKSSPKDLVTETDKSVEDLVISRLKNAFPTHKFIGEESVAAGVKCELTDDPTWIIDPVDGTMNFVHSFPYSCISIGLWINKTAEIGFVFNPMLDQMFTARKGKGAFLNGEKMSVSGQKELEKSLLSVELGTRSDPMKTKVIINNIKKLATVAHGIRSMGSAALNMAHVAMGGIDAGYEIGIHAWDMAAGSLLVTEAGGIVVDVNGFPFDILGRRVLCAASKELADQIVKIIEIYEEERD